MTYINQLAGLDTYTGTPKQEFVPPISTDVQYTYPIPPLIPDMLTGGTIYQSQEYSTGQRVGAIAKCAAVVGILLGGIWGVSEGKIHNPFTPERIHVETNNPGYSTVDPGHINLSR